MIRCANPQRAPSLQSMPGLTGFTRSNPPTGHVLDYDTGPCPRPHSGPPSTGHRLIDGPRGFALAAPAGCRIPIRFLGLQRPPTRTSDRCESGLLPTPTCDRQTKAVLNSRAVRRCTKTPRDTVRVGLAGDSVVSLCEFSSSTSHPAPNAPQIVHPWALSSPPASVCTAPSSAADFHPALLACAVRSK